MAAGDYYGQDLAWLGTELTAWKAAHTALASAASYQIGSGGSSRQLTRVDLPMVRATMRDLKAEIDRQNSVSRPRTSYPDLTRAFS